MLQLLCRAAADSLRTEAMPAGRVWLVLRPCEELLDPVGAGEKRMVELSSNFSMPPTRCHAWHGSNCNLMRE